MLVGIVGVIIQVTYTRGELWVTYMIRVRRLSRVTMIRIVAQG